MARTVLVADDSPTHQRKANGILTGEGLEVITVSNGVAAIKKLPGLKPMVVLADVSMPGKDGYEVCEFVKSSPDLRNVPVLLIVSDMEPYDEARAARVGADGKVRKPFGDDLAAIVNRSIAQYEAAQPKFSIPAAVPPPPIEAPLEPMPEEEEAQPAEQKLDLGGLSEGAAFFEESPAIAPQATAPESEFVSAEEAAPAEASEYMGESAAAGEPMLIEETTPVEAPQEEEEEAVRTMIFRAPVQIAEPMLADDLAMPMPTEEFTPEAAEPEAAAAATLDSYSLSEATAGHVRFAAPETEAAPAFEAPAETPPPPADVSEPVAEAFAPAEEAPAPVEAAPPPPAPPALPDASMVFSIVHKVVLRMSPRALPAQAVEGIARTIADEISAELASESPSNS